MRRLFCILLLLCLPLQSFALQAGHPHAAGIAHELEHDQGIEHHHHDDGDGASVHYDDSDESVEHVLDHAASLQPFGLPLPALSPFAPTPLVTLVPRDPAQYLPDPHLDCPHRPPACALG